jgi:hypothetical protein
MRQHFSEYIPLSSDEKTAVWNEAIFVFDTNILLNLYRMSVKSSENIINIMNKLKERLFLPHQVGVEFYRHREEEIAKQINAFEHARATLKKLPAQFSSGFNRHPCIPINEIIDSLDKCASEQIDRVNQSQKSNNINFFAFDDPILPQLDAIFAGVSEGPYADAENDALNKKVEDRVKKNMSPCYVPLGAKSAPTTADNPHQGDGRVWFQIVKHAEEKKQSIVFVTGDEKPNWWRTVKLGNQERTVGPHFDLIRDIESASGKKFLMYSQEEFLKDAHVFIGVPEQTQTIAEVQQIREADALEKDEGGTGDTQTIAQDELKSQKVVESAQKADSPEKDSGSIDQPKGESLGESDNQKADSEGKEEV